MKKCILVVGLLVLAGCSSEAIKWENAGTLVSVRPDEEASRPPGRLGTALGDTELGCTRVETTKGVFVVNDKIGLANTGVPVTVGYIKKDSSDEYRDTPSYLAFGGQRYEIAR